MVPVSLAQLVVGRDKCILYAGVRVRIPNTPLLHV